MDAAVPLRWWSARQIDQVAATLAEPWTGWLRGWHAAAAGASVRCLLAHDAEPARGWTPCAGTGRSLAWWDRTDDASAVETAIFGSGCQVALSTVAGALEQRSRSALRHRLAQALGLAPSDRHEAAASAQFGPWSGGVVVELTSARLSMRLLLNGACVGALIGSPEVPDGRPSETPVEDGVSPVPVRASVEVTGCEITLGALQSIRCGDVLQLPHSLDQPLDVTVEARRICTAFLGAHDGHRAVELGTL